MKEWRECLKNRLSTVTYSPVLGYTRWCVLFFWKKDFFVCEYFIKNQFMKEIRLLNYVFLLLLIVSHVESVQAQEENTFTKQWSWGVKSGFNVAHIHNFLPALDSVAITAKKRIDIMGTVFLNRRFSPYFISLSTRSDPA